MARRNRKVRLSPKLPKRKAVETPTRRILQVGRNDPCPCGSGKKYKDCHESKGEAFLSKMAKEKEKERTMAERGHTKGEGVPWYRRLFLK